MNWRQYAFPAAILGIAAIVGVVVLIANSGGDDGKGTSACRDVEQPQPKPAQDRKRPTLRLSTDKTYRAAVETSCGAFTFILDPQNAPKTGGSFVTLARDGFYDGLTFHRIAPGFVVQGGDPAGNGTGGPGYKVREAPPKDVVYSEGVVAMAKGGDEPAGTSGSQFFIVTGKDTGLPPDYAVLGRVEKGMKSVQAIAEQNTAQDGPPAKPIVIDKVTITEDPNGPSGQ